MQITLSKMGPVFTLDQDISGLSTEIRWVGAGWWLYPYVVMN